MSIMEDREKNDDTTREYYFAVYLNLLDYLVQEYRKPGMANLVAGTCDLKLDRSGRLLGRVRQLASEANERAHPSS